jgi:hypothetical protein
MIQEWYKTLYSKESDFDLERKEARGALHNTEKGGPEKEEER